MRKVAGRAEVAVPLLLSSGNSDTSMFGWFFYREKKVRMLYILFNVTTWLFLYRCHFLMLRVPLGFHHTTKWLRKQTNKEVISMKGRGRSRILCCIDFGMKTIEAKNDLKSLNILKNHLAVQASTEHIYHCKESTASCVPCHPSFKLATSIKMISAYHTEPLKPLNPPNQHHRTNRIKRPTLSPNPLQTIALGQSSPAFAE